MNYNTCKAIFLPPGCFIKPFYAISPRNRAPQSIPMTSSNKCPVRAERPSWSPCPSSLTLRSSCCLPALLRRRWENTNPSSIVASHPHREAAPLGSRPVVQNHLMDPLLWCEEWFLMVLDSLLQLLFSESIFRMKWKVNELINQE